MLDVEIQLKKSVDIRKYKLRQERCIDATDFVHKYNCIFKCNGIVLGHINFQRIYLFNAHLNGISGFGFDDISEEYEFLINLENHDMTDVILITEIIINEEHRGNRLLKSLLVVLRDQLNYDLNEFNIVLKPYSLLGKDKESNLKLSNYYASLGFSYQYDDVDHMLFKGIIADIDAPNSTLQNLRDYCETLMLIE